MLGFGVMECRAEGALTTTGVLIAIYVAKLSCWRLEAMQYRCGVYCNGLGVEGGGRIGTLLCSGFLRGGGLLFENLCAIEAWDRTERY